MQENQIHDFFSGFAKLVYVIPVLILLLGLYIRYGSQQDDYKPKQSVSFNPTHIPAVSSPKKQNTFIPTKSFTCRLDDKIASMSAYRNGRHIKFEMRRNAETTTYLVDDDCLYTWKSGVNKGQKQCGVNQQIDIVDMLLSSGMVQTDSLIDFVPTDIVPAEITKFIKTCKNIPPPKDPLLFTFPKGVVFEDMRE